MKKIKKVIVIAMLIFVLLFNNTVYAVGVEDSLNHQDYKVEFNVLDQWESGYQAQVMIINTGTSTISDWSMEFVLGQEIVEIWNATIEEVVENKYRIGNLEWNSDIPVGGSVTFGFLANGKFEDDFLNCVVISESENDIIDNNLYIGDGYEVEFNLIDSWEQAYSAEIIIKNTGDTEIENWMLEFSLAQDIVDIWNAEVQNYENQNYLINHLSWNADIPVNGSVTFGFVTDGEFIKYPEVYLLSMEKVEALNEDYEIIYDIISRWDGGFTGNISIINKTDDIIEDWELEFSYENEIEEMWGGVIYDHTEKDYKLSNVGYNRNIPAYGSVEIGFNVYNGDTEKIIENIELKKHIIPISTQENNWISIDTDGDGLPDCYEQHITFTSAETPFTDGVNADGERDEDGDKLCNLEEYYILTNAYSEDTDYDGLTDYDEVTQYLTNPLEYDTDYDGVGDWTEIMRGSDPLNTDSNFDGVKDGEDIITYGLCENQYVLLDSDKMGYSVDIEITGNGDYNNKITLLGGVQHSGFPDIQYLVGEPLYIEHDEITFESAQISFTLNDNIIAENNINNLQFASYDENTHKIEFIDTIIDNDNKTLICKTNHFSYYFLIDKVKLFDYYLLNSSDINKVLTDVVFVIDSTGSMSGMIQNTKESLVKAAALTEELGLNVNYGLVDYKDIVEDNYTSQFWGWYAEEQKFQDEIIELAITGGGNEPESVVDALETARISGFRDSAMKSIVLVTDATYREETNFAGLDSMEVEISRLIEDDIAVSVIVPTRLNDYYTDLAQKTGGEIFGIDTDYAESLVEVYTRISDAADGYTWVRLSDGTIVKLLVDPETTSEDDKTDTDGDGNPDMEELTDRTEIKYGGESYVVWNYASNPAKFDNPTQETYNCQELTVYEMYEGIKEIESCCMQVVFEEYYTIEVDGRNSITEGMYRYMLNTTMLYYIQKDMYNNDLWKILTGINEPGQIFHEVVVCKLDGLTQDALAIEYMLNMKDCLVENLNNNVQLRSYKEVLMIDPVTGQRIDMPHWAASCNAHYNQSSNVFVFPIEMASWGGDLQTFAAEVAYYSTSTTSEANIQKYIELLFLSENSSFSAKDYLADIDAVNCYVKLEENLLSVVFQQYYLENEVSKRNTLFLEYYNGDLSDKMDDLFPAVYFGDGTITEDERKMHDITHLHFLKERLDDLEADVSLWPSSTQINVLINYFEDYVRQQAMAE